MAAVAATSSLSSPAPPSVAPIDIQLPKVMVSVAAAGVTAAAAAAVAVVAPSSRGESLGGDSGYESSWPSLSEAAAWSSAQTGVRKGGGGGGGAWSSHHHHPHHYHPQPPHHHRRTFGHSPTTTSSSPDMFGSSSGGGPGASMLLHHHHQNHHHHHRQQSGAAPHHHHHQQQHLHQHQHQQMNQPSGKKYKHRRRRAAQTLGHQTLEQPNLEPLVDFGSPVMDEVDEVHHNHQELPIPLSAIPRRWLYEEDEASGDDDVLVTVPKREWVYCSNSKLSMDVTHFEWNTRRETILNQIVFMDADIICLQEIEKQDFEEYFEPQLARLGYRSIHAYKTNLYETRDGCALFYRDSRFELNDHHVLRYNQTDLDDEKRPSMARDTAIRFNLFHNLAIVALLKNRRTHRLVQIATTHLLADPAYPDAKMLQSAILVSKLEELKAKALAVYGHCGHPVTHVARQHSHIHHCYHPANYRPMARVDNRQPRPALSSSPMSTATTAPTFKPCPALDIPTVIAGDFNSLPHSSVINFLKTGRVETSHFGGHDFGRFTRKPHKFLYHSLELADCYKDSTLPYTNVTRNFEGTIDYMLFAKKSLSLVGFLDHLEKLPAPSSTTDDQKNPTAKGGGGGAEGGGGSSGRSKMKKKVEIKESIENIGRRGPLQFVLHPDEDDEDDGVDVDHDGDDDDDDDGMDDQCQSEGSDLEEPTMSTDSHGEMSGVGDDDSSGSDADQEGMDLGLRSTFTPTTIWSSLTPLQQQRLTLASRTYSTTPQAGTTTSAIATTKTATATAVAAAAAGTKGQPHFAATAASATGATNAPATATAAVSARYPLPTMPSQYFPSDHLPLAAVFKERDMTVCCCSQSCRRRTDDPML
ncbi:Glucose-repressible alcohol dehydrogenase transcriptional effector [Actinomortierella ambigua]|nr:Glucose-repressible alcohol dehydrogenase transcriptional effector [Actinomortierella ambigua]